MPEELPVHISRESLHTVEVPGEFETDGPFDIRLINHGTSLHVHVHLDDRLSEVATVDAGNHYVEGDAERLVRVDVAENRTEDVFGRLKVATAYGAETRWVNVDLTVPDEDEGTVRVDESLSKPAPQPDPEEPGLIDRPQLAVVAVGLLALVIAGASAAVLGNPLVTAGALVVLIGVGVALVVLRG